MRTHGRPSDIILFLSLLTFLSPLPFYLLDYLITDHSYSPLRSLMPPLYGAVAGMETLLGYLLFRRKRGGFLTTARYVRQEYLLRTLLGLPLTVFLLLQTPAGNGAVLRFLSSFWLVYLLGGRGAGRWFALLYFSGGVLMALTMEQTPRSVLEGLLWSAMGLGSMLYASRLWKKQRSYRR